MNKVGQLRAGLLLFVVIGWSSLTAASQQPFVTDDAEVTGKGKFHFEIANEFDRLQPESLPLDYQNNLKATFAYGLIKNLEISFGGQFLALASVDHPRYVAGIGDSTIGAKYVLRRETEGSRIPAFAMSAYFKVPTGSAPRRLGSGLSDFGVIGIAQKSYKTKNTFRANAGYLLAGNTLTGALGLSSVRGHVFLGTGSYVRTISDKLQLGGEISGAVTSNFRLSRGQLQTQFGGNYNLTKNSTLDFGLIAGKYAASPRFGFQVGYSIDF